MKPQPSSKKSIQWGDAMNLKEELNQFKKHTHEHSLQELGNWLDQNHKTPRKMRPIYKIAASFAALMLVLVACNMPVQQEEELGYMIVGIVEAEGADLEAPHLFYSRPKGTYKGADTEKVMLDFYLLNTTLSAEGNKVKATINGQEFTIDTWQPHFVEGLPMGENSFKLELVDKDGNYIEGPFNRVERTVTLSEA